jgi:hypothetical protein
MICYDLDNINYPVTIAFPTGLAKESKQDDQIVIADAIKTQTDKLTFVGDSLKVSATVSTDGLATEVNQDTQIANQGTDGATPPTIAGTGIRGWLRGIYEKLSDSEANAPIMVFNTTTPLVATANFDSGILSLLNKSQVETSILSDVDGTINISFYNDAIGTDLVRALSIPYLGGSGYQYFAAPAFTNYVKYEFLNGGSPQTDFLYQTKVLTSALSGQMLRIDGTIVDSMVVPLTRSILTGVDASGKHNNIKSTPSGNLAATLLDSHTGSRQIIDLNGAAKFGEAIILVGDVFGSNSPSALQWDTETVGSGASFSELGLQRLETGTTADSELRFQSVKKARFMLSQFNIFHCGLRIDNIADANCERRWGAFDPINATQNGAYFALIDGAWNVGYCKDGVETLVPQANWNGINKDSFNANPALAVYEVHYNAGSIFFFQGTNFIHKVSGLPSPYAAEYNFKVGAEVVNKNGNTTNNGIDVYALGTYRLGEERGETISRVFSANTTIKAGAGYVANAYLSRTGSGGGSASLSVYDGIDNTGTLMARIDIGADDVKGIGVNSTFSEGLYVEVSGTGTKSATIGYE